MHLTHGHRSLLELDPDLGAGLAPRRAAAARARLVVRLVPFEPGTVQAPAGIGLLVTAGFMARVVALEHRSAAELLGPGDLLRPWQDDGDHAVYPFESDWRTLRALTVAVLDRAFAARAAPYPEVMEALIGRAIARSRRAAGQMVLSQLASVEHRVLLALWHLADEWGRVRPDGISVPVPLTHELLGQTVGARRPSVTTALNALGARGLAFADRDGGFLLKGEPPQDLPLVRGTYVVRR